MLAAACVVSVSPQSRSPLTPGARVRLHAHNCYPQRGQYADRIERALATGVRPIVIEQDVLWRAGANGGESVVTHEKEAAAEAPALEAHFFQRVVPLLDRALAEGRRDEWPMLVLHLDFKSNEPEHHAAIWKLLGKYERYLTTAERAADRRVTPFVPGPLLVLTERGEGQEHAFYDEVPAGARLRLFGTVPPDPAVAARGNDATVVASNAPELLIPGGATSYRRWTNFAWNVIEAGGQQKAGDWTAADRARLDAVVSRAHAQGLFVRFYTLNGYSSGQSQGWTESYNFGSIDAVRQRWRAAIESGIDFVATDQYEDFARELTTVGHVGHDLLSR
jgi:hypothetical protein